MKINTTTLLTHTQKSEIFGLWNNEYPDFLKYPSLTELEEYLAKLEHTIHHLAERENRIVGWAAVFDRNDERWFLIIVDSANHLSGIGKELMNSIMQYNEELNGWVIDHDDYIRSDGRRYKSPIEFYLKLGFRNTGEQLDNQLFSAVKVHWHK